MGILQGCILKKRSQLDVCSFFQVLNGAIAASLFNILYDVVLSQKVKWYAMCPVIDFLNHRSSVQVFFLHIIHSANSGPKTYKLGKSLQIIKPVSQ